MIHYYSINKEKPENPVPIDVERFKFPAGEIHMNRGKDADYAIFQAEAKTLNDELIELSLWSNARKLSGKEAHLFIPYLPAARADRGIPFGSQVYSTIINSSDFSSLHSLDVHSPVMKSLMKNFCEYEPSPISLFAFKEGYTGIIAPDKGAVERAQKAAELLGIPCYEATKERDFSTGKLLSFKAPKGLPKDGKYLLVDDICDGGGTFAGLAEELDLDPSNLDLFITHGVFSKNAPSILEKYYGKIFTTDSYISDNLENFTKLTIIPLMEEYHKHILSNHSS